MFEKKLKFVSIILATAIMIPSFCGFSSSAVSNVSTLTIDSISSSDYISRSDCELLAKDFISNEITSSNDSDLTWDDNTEISETVPLHDIDNNINSYIFNLTTNGKETGYIQVEAYSQYPNIIAFGYKEKNSIDKALSYDNKQKSSNSDLDKFSFNKSNIVYLGGCTFLSKSTDNKYFDITSGNLCNESYSELKEHYNNHRDELKNIAAGSISESSSTDNLTPFTKAIAPLTDTSSGNLTYMSSMTKFSANDLIADGITVMSDDCAVIAGMNIVYYWGQHRSKPELCSSSISTNYNNLRTDMEIDANGGATDYTFINGLITYGNDCGYTAAGSDNQTSPTQSWVKTNIANQNIFLIRLTSDTTYGNHAITCVGWKTTSTRFYVRVLDAYSDSTSNFYNFGSGYVSACDYVRWS